MHAQDPKSHAKSWPLYGKMKVPCVLTLTLLFILLLSLFVASQTETNFLSHSIFDSYTLQALAWREGQTHLSQNYPWLELAIFNGDYYVSFPPTPTIPMLLLSFIFGEETPSTLVTLLYFLGGCAAAFYLSKRYLTCTYAAALTIFIALGGSLLDIAVSSGGFSGGVWYQAQMLAFLLTMLSFLLIDSSRPGAHATSLILIALAVGCRPLNALYVPFLLYMLYQRVKQPRLIQTIRAMLPYIIVPGLIAVAYGAYNMTRFHNPLEFGHAYLPEYTESGETVFSLVKMKENLLHIFQPPQLIQGMLSFSITGGFAVYLTNPMFVFGIARTGHAIYNKEAKTMDYILLATIMIHFASFLTHRTNGGWQYGTRYLSDVVPALVYLFIRAKKPIRLFESLAMGALILFNIYGTIVFHTL